MWCCKEKSGISGKESAWICDSCFPGRNVCRTGLRADGRCGRIFQCSGKSGNEIAERTYFCSRIKFCVYGRCGTVYRKQFYNECSIYKRRSFLGENDQSVDRLLSGKSARFCCDSRNLYDDRTDERTGSRNVLEKCGSGESLRSSDGAFCKSDPL